jgi:ribosome recycling factor
VITPYDKSALKAIEQALREMPNLDANPQNDGNLIRVVLPDLTEERRKEYVKLVKAKAEDARVAIRNIRRKGNDDLAALKKDGLAGDDEITRAEKELDTATKTHVDAIDDALKRKEAELLEV